MNPLKVSLFGRGKMGKLIERLAPLEGHLVVEPIEAEVCIDFSHPEALLNHLRWAIEHQKSIVIGTTGWETEISMAQKLVSESNIGVIASPNFSLGVFRFIELLKKAATLFPHYEMAGVEYHHSEKRDNPSGTAKKIAQELNMQRPFIGLRCGRIPGKHTVLFDSPFDSITITHEAHSREAFAQGALQAAAWIKDKKGWFTLSDMIGAEI